ncbi:hypothetical protein GYB22_10555 [bacterium]|nr:hypothetical protein [bacterium]
MKPLFTALLIFLGFSSLAQHKDTFYSPWINDTLNLYNSEVRDMREHQITVIPRHWCRWCCLLIMEPARGPVLGFGYDYNSQGESYFSEKKIKRGLLSIGKYVEPLDMMFELEYQFPLQELEETSKSEHHGFSINAWINTSYVFFGFVPYPLLRPGIKAGYQKFSTENSYYLEPQLNVVIPRGRINAYYSYQILLNPPTENLYRSNHHFGIKYYLITF